MPYATAEARQQLLDTLADAAGLLSVALAALSEAYELLDEQTAERMETELFGPVQLAYGRLKGAHTGFAGRHQLPGGAFEPAIAGAPSGGARGFLDAAVLAVSEADQGLASLQDSMLPVEVGDVELRAQLEQVRTLLSNFTAHERELIRTLGR